MAGLTLTLPPQLAQRDPLEFSDDDFSTFAPHSGHFSSDDEPKCADVGHGYVTDDGEGEEEAGWHQYQQVHDEGNVVMVAFTTEVNDEGMVMMTTLAPEMQNAFTDAYGTDGNTEAIAAYPDIQPYPDIQLNEDDQDSCCCPLVKKYIFLPHNITKTSNERAKKRERMQNDREGHK